MGIIDSRYSYFDHIMRLHVLLLEILKIAQHIAYPGTLGLSYCDGGDDDESIYHTN